MIYWYTTPGYSTICQTFLYVVVLGFCGSCCGHLPNRVGDGESCDLIIRTSEKKWQNLSGLGHQKTPMLRNRPFINPTLKMWKKEDIASNIYRLRRDKHDIQKWTCNSDDRRYFVAVQWCAIATHAGASLVGDSWILAVLSLSVLILWQGRHLHSGKADDWALSLCETAACTHPSE